MSKGWKVSLAIVAVLVIAVAAAIWFYWRHPIAFTRFLGRTALQQAGFVESTVETPVGKVAVWEAGRGSPIVLLHGAGDYAGGWALVAPSLAKNYRVIIPDLPGHGYSEPAEGPLKFSDVLRGLESVVMQRRDGQPVVLVGNSMGGHLALLYANRHTEQVARIVSVNGGGLRLPRPVSLTPVSREEARALMSLLLDPASPMPPGYVLDDLVRTSNQGAIGRLMQEYGDFEANLLDGRLHEVTTPVDLVWGESDKLLDLDYARRLEAGLVAARLTTLPRCGHVPLRECPAALTRELERLLKEDAPLPKALPVEPAAQKPTP
jgi:pimeloyl-ACP methyl ester carboxylesterase